MKNKLTNNIGLKILSVIAAMCLWLVVVNVDDPVISRTYSGIPVEVVNGDAITSEGKTYEILDGSDTISVVVSAKRSVIEEMSKDYIKATADMKDMTFMDTVVIEVRSTRYSDRIESITPRTRNLKVQIEDLQRKQFEITVETAGSPNSGYIVGSLTPAINILSVSGPVSIVSKITEAKAIIDVTGMSNDISTSTVVNLYDASGEVIQDEMLESSVTEVHVDAEILETKEIPLAYAISGTPAEGYGATGIVESTPSTVVIAGDGNNFNNMSVLSIPAERISVAGASADVAVSIDLTEYLPNGVQFADPEFDGIATVTAYVGRLQRKEIDVPTTNITIENVPEGYTAVLVDIGGLRRFEVQGLGEAFEQLDAATLTGVIDASAMSPRTIEGELTEGTVYAGSNDGQVRFSFPSGVTETSPVYMEVILNPIGETVTPAENNETETIGEQ